MVLGQSGDLSENDTSGLQKGQLGPDYYASQ